MFNKYSVYSQNAQNFLHTCDDKILVDIHRLNNINEYDDVVKYVKEIWGDFEGERTFSYPNNVLVIIRNKENCIEIGALKNNKQILGLGWKCEQS